jgi:hypothetical protein
MRMCVVIGYGPVRSPSCVTDANGSLQVFFIEKRCKIIDATSAPS